MISQNLLNELNTAYAPLEAKCKVLLHALARRAWETESGWYNGHCQKNVAGEWVRDAYPIPVISVKGLCDIELQFDRISVSTKLTRRAALAYSFEKLAAYEFEAYGVEDYLSDYCHPGQSLHNLKNNIISSHESEIGFSFTFPFGVDADVLLAFVTLLKTEGFYY